MQDLFHHQYVRYVDAMVIVVVVGMKCVLFFCPWEGEVLLPRIGSCCKVYIYRERERGAQSPFFERDGQTMKHLIKLEHIIENSRNNNINSLSLTTLKIHSWCFFISWSFSSQQV